MTEEIEALLAARRIETLAVRLRQMPDADLACVPPGAVNLAVESLSQNGRAPQAATLYERGREAGLDLALPVDCAEALMRGGHAARARDLLSDWTPADAPRPHEILAQAQALIRHREWGAALAVLHGAAETFPDHAAIARLIGHCALWQGERAVATEALARSAALDPDQPAWVSRALAALESDRMETGGLTLILPPEVISPQTIAGLASGHYERHEREAVLADLREGDRVLELGAGIGAIAMWIAKVRPDLPVTCVEGNLELAPLIRRNFEINRCAATLIEGLAALEDGEAQFHLSPNFWASSTRPIDEATKEVRLPCLDTRRVVVETRPTILVVDIEGAEAEILPALDLNGIRRVIVEVHPQIITPAQVSAVLRALLVAGFEIDLTLDRGDVYVFDRPET